MIIKDKSFKIYFSRQELANRVAAMGQEITKAYEGKSPLFIGVLNGSFIFMADLVRAIQLPADMGFIRFSSYQGMHSTGKMVEYMGFDERIHGRHVVIVEDIVDTGLTMNFLLQEIKKHEPASVKTAVLLFKKEALKTDTQVDYFGFEIPNRFVVGYGLDYDEQGRHLPDLYALDEG
jgi:hypoxanthine phosphoribosyltransferase